jgi:uncharacterized HAD superfamily protein
MKKPIIAVDIDEVLMPHFGDLIGWYNSQFGTALTLYDNHPSDPGNWGTDDIEVAIRRVHQFYDTHEFKTSKPLKEAQSVLERLRSRYELVIVTARDTVLEAATTDWLDEHFKEIFSAVHFTRHFSLEGKRRPKAEILHEENASYFIDDSLEHVLAAAQRGISCILFGDYAWNQSKELPNNVVRCKNWRTVEGSFNGIS